jgi:hypothetical protein
MTDDIVTRLREGEKLHRNGYVEVPSGFYEWLANEIERERSQAADEIERLRKLVSTWIICAERLVESNDGKEYEQANAFYLECQRIANETRHE